MTYRREPIWYHGVPSGFWTRSENHRAFMEWLEEKLEIKTPEDWYVLDKKAVTRYGGAGLLPYYNDSPREMVKNHVPWYDFKDWLFRQVPAGFWNDPANGRDYMEWLGEKLGFETWEDWYRVSTRDFNKNKGARLLFLFGGRPREVVMAHFPEHEWQKWKFRYVPAKFWADPLNCQLYFDWLGKELGFQETEDWYGLTTIDFSKNHGRGLIKKYGSLPEIMRALFPDHEWHDWKFKVAPQGFWLDPDNRRRYLEWLRAELGYETFEDWYRLSRKDLIDNYGTGLLNSHRGSPAAVLRAAYPDYEWLEWGFAIVPDGFWSDRRNRRRYLDWLAGQLGYERPEDWYSLSVAILEAHRGHSMIREFDGSPSAVAKFYHPDFEWKEWLFSNCPLNFFRERKNRRRYFEWLASELELELPEDWYSVSWEEIMQHHGSSILNKIGKPLVDLLNDAFPEHEWKEWLFMKAPVGFWDERENRRRYVEWLGEELGFDRPEDWFRVRNHHFYQNKGAVLIARLGNARQVLRDVFAPDHPVNRPENHRRRV